jgi:hypothetical protein
MPLTDFYIRWSNVSATTAQGKKGAAEALAEHHAYAVKAKLSVVEPVIKAQLMA